MNALPMSESESIKSFSVQQVREADRSVCEDWLAVEEPMEIRVVFGPPEKRTGKSLSITMRTPGSDFELAAGFLFTEGILSKADEITRFEAVGPVAEGRTAGNIIRAELASGFSLDVQRFQRHFYTTSSCGICGKASLDAIRNLGIHRIPDSGVRFSRSLISAWPAALRARQPIFSRTGGIHAAGLFGVSDQPHLVREDVGRHNALDKLIGRRLLDDALPATGQAIVVSGRASFELVQKGVASGAEVMVAVGAPSSLAVEMAEEFGMTLIGFASPTRFNVYCHGQRIEER